MNANDMNITQRPWPRTRGPLRDLRRSDQLAGDLASPRWADHQFTGRDDKGGTVYVCCPYQLRGASLSELAYLESLGWHVLIHADSLYGNGTTQIELRRKESNDLL